MTAPIQQAVILAAGQGTRLRQGQQDYPKPLYPLRDRPLIGHVMDAFCDHGIKRFFVVVGFEKEQVMPGIEAAVPPGASLTFIDNPDWRLNNGVSLLKAKDEVRGRFFLSMSDHIFHSAMVAALEQGAQQPDSLYLAVDRKLDSVFDMDDATKVRSEADRIVAIDKELEEFDAVDTGLFLCPDDVFSFLARARVDGDCSLSDGVRAMAGEGRARIVDIGAARWQDVDTPDMLGQAEKLL